MPRFTTLYSGSSGNSAVIESQGRFILIDMGKNCKHTLLALESAGLDPLNLQAVFVTHDHSDHVKGLRVFSKRWPVPVYATEATLQGLHSTGALLPDTCTMAVDAQPCQVGEFVVESFPTNHDTPGCCGYRVTYHDRAMALATDLGTVTDIVYQNLCNAQLVALEANYEPAKLQGGPYPYYLKQRIASNTGHLSNRESATTVASLLANGCAQVAICHLSEENNHPTLVLEALQRALLEYRLPATALDRVQVARRHRVSPWLEF